MTVTFHRRPDGTNRSRVNRVLIALIGGTRQGSIGIDHP